jgi:hypothetical protein
MGPMLIIFCALQAVNQTSSSPSETVR